MADLRHRGSFATRVLIAAAAWGAAAGTLGAALAAGLPHRPVLAALLAAGLGAAGALAAVAVLLRPVRRALSALGDGVRGFRDSDYSLRLVPGADDEVGELIALYNELADALRGERQELSQRELLLESVLQTAPMAVVLLGPGGRVVYENRSARDLLSGGRRLLGRDFAEVAAESVPELQRALAAPGDGLVVRGEGSEQETFRLARREVVVSSRAHRLIALERLTPELRRREVEVWKQAIRVMNHELNNSLAPIRSLAHSARAAAGSVEHAHRVGEILASLEERAVHLAAFLEGYARFARLPPPRVAEVGWDGFLERVRTLAPFRVEGRPPATPGVFDPVQMEQVLLNLLKNAREAGSPEQEIAVSVLQASDGSVVLRVADRGAGMDAESLHRALLPFRSSKPGGTGIGLALCRDILDAHGGSLRVEPRPDGGTLVTIVLPPR